MPERENAAHKTHTKCVYNLVSFWILINIHRQNTGVCVRVRKCAHGKLFTMKTPKHTLAQQRV